MILEDLINTYEILKKNIYIIKRGDKNPILIKFEDSNFYHLVGLHKTNFDLFIPQNITSKTKKYKYIKTHMKKFNNILNSEIKENETLKYRITTFNRILDLLDGISTTLYNLQIKTAGSVYDGDYGLLKIYENVNCLLGLKIDNEINNTINCAPQSWMASNKVNYLIKFKNPIYMYEIVSIPIEMYNDEYNFITA